MIVAAIAFLTFIVSNQHYRYKHRNTTIAMGKVLPEISSSEEEFINQQKVFFVGTAPLSKDHHVSISPKANDGTCIVIDPHTIAYADYTGSGAETAAHIIQNQRLTVMFCNIQHGPPKILRLFGNAELIIADQVPLSLLKKFPSNVTQNYGFRAVYVLHVHRISSSCGYSLPIMEFTKFRSTLNDVTEKLGKDGVSDYITLKNSYSIDGLPSLALLRENAPPNIEPISEDGYIYGRQSQNKQSHGKKRFPLQLQPYQKSILSKRTYIRIRDVAMALIVAYIAGIVTGGYAFK